MSNQIPKSVKVLKALLITRLALIALIIITFFIVKDTDPAQHNFASGLKQGIINGAHLKSTSPTNMFWYLIGVLIMPTIFTLSTLAFVDVKQFKTVLTLVIIDFIFGFGNGLPIFQTVFLIMVLTQPTKNYLKNKVQQNTEQTNP